MKGKNMAENYRVISDDKRTVKIGHQSKMIFKIYDQRNNDAFQIEISPDQCVTDLMKAIHSQKFIKKSKRIICLESLDNRQVIDYALLINNYQLKHFHNYESFKMVIGQQPISDKWISLNDFTFKKCLGQGASANVCLVRHKGNGRLYALKQIEKSYFVEFKRMQQVLREKKIMTEIVSNFPFCAKLYASFQSENHLNFLLEFYPGGQMFFHLHKKRLTEKQAKLYFTEMVLTFEYLHQQKVIYRDLKPQNIMIDFNGHAKLTDFGLCKINLDKTDLTTSYCGSIQYMAPQVKENIGYNYSVDFYTLGAFLYEMVMGVPPYYNSQQLYFNESNSSEYQFLVRGLIQNQIEMRISSFEHIKKSKWLIDVNWESIKQGITKMPFSVSPYETYIHDQFKGISVSQFNVKHEEKYDRLFHFFTYFDTNDVNNQDLLKFYGNTTFMHQSKRIMKRQTTGSTSSINKSKMKKKFSRDKSLRENSRSNSKSKRKGSENSEKSSNTSRSKKTTTTNIYLKKVIQPQKQRNSSLKNHIVFKKTSTLTKQPLRHLKSDKDILHNALSKPY